LQFYAKAIVKINIEALPHTQKLIAVHFLPLSTSIMSILVHSQGFIISFQVIVENNKCTRIVLKID